MDDLILYTWYDLSDLCDVDSLISHALLICSASSTIGERARGGVLRFEQVMARLDGRKWPVPLLKETMDLLEV